LSAKVGGELEPKIGGKVALVSLCGGYMPQLQLNLRLHQSVTRGYNFSDTRLN